jgi:hypothetical protein
MGFQSPVFGESTGTGKPADPTVFSLRDLRLYMTADEALPVMKSLVGEYLNRLRVSYGPCIQEKIAALREHRAPRNEPYMAPHPGTVCVTSMSFEENDSNGHLQVRLEFAEDAPGSLGTVRLWRIDFFQGNMPTAADAKAFFAAIVQKFGVPTSVGLDGLGPVVYCGETGPAKTCRINPYTTGNYDSSTNSAKIECCEFAPQLAKKGFYARWNGSGVSIDVWDVAFRLRLAQEEEKMIGNTRTTGKPVI